jgi:hypothetical protein
MTIIATMAIIKGRGSYMEGYSIALVFMYTFVSISRSQTQGLHTIPW